MQQYENYKNRSWVICGKGSISGKAFDNLQRKKEEGWLIIGVNDFYLHSPVKCDFIIWLDSIYNTILLGHTDEKLLCPILSNSAKRYFNQNRKNVYLEFAKTVRPDFDYTSRNICSCPFSGVAALDFVHKTQPKEVILMGFSSGTNHNYFYGYEGHPRDKNTNQVYIENIKSISETIGNISIDIYDENFGIIESGTNWSEIK